MFINMVRKGKFVVQLKDKRTGEQIKENETDENFDVEVRCEGPFFIHVKSDSTDPIIFAINTDGILTEQDVRSGKDPRQFIELDPQSRSPEGEIKVEVFEDIHPHEDSVDNFVSTKEQGSEESIGAPRDSKKATKSDIASISHEGTNNSKDVMYSKGRLLETFRLKFTQGYY